MNSYILHCEMILKWVTSKYIKFAFTKLFRRNCLKNWIDQRILCWNNKRRYQRGRGLGINQRFFSNRSTHFLCYWIKLENKLCNDYIIEPSFNTSLGKISTPLICTGNGLSSLAIKMRCIAITN